MPVTATNVLIQKYVKFRGNIFKPLRICNFPMFVAGCFCLMRCAHTVEQT